MGDVYNMAYDNTQTDSYELLQGPTSYDEQLPEPKPAVSSMTELSSNTGKHSDVRSSNTSLQTFFIIFASLIIGGVIGGAITYLVTKQGDPEGSSANTFQSTTGQCPSSQSCPACPTCQMCPTISDNITGDPDGSSANTIQSTTGQCPSSQSCPACPTCQMCPTISDNIAGDPEGSSANTIQSTTGQCPSSQSCPACPTCQMCPTISDNITDYPVDCQEVMDRGNIASGEYMISPLNVEASFPVWCDMDTDGGGWTTLCGENMSTGSSLYIPWSVSPNKVLQRRMDGSVDFYLGWIHYLKGFGDVDSEHWLGNQKIYRITSQGNYELRIDMSDFEGNNVYAKYTNFKLGGVHTDYVLTVGGYCGNAGDSLSHHNNHPFSTKDKDNRYDGSGENCAVLYKGAWWYGPNSQCHTSNLNGMYLEGETTSFADGVVWYTWKGHHYSLKTSVMKIRRVA